jgi:hypothetical protein
MTPYTFKIVPFSKQLIRKNRLHIVDEDRIGGSTVETVLDGFIKAEMPRNFAICYFKCKPCGMAVVFTINSKQDPYGAFDDDDDFDGPVGFLHAYVRAKHRDKGIGEKLVDMAMRDFVKNNPEIDQVRVSSILRPKFKKYSGVTPVYSRYGVGPVPSRSFLKKVAVSVVAFSAQREKYFLGNKGRVIVPISIKYPLYRLLQKGSQEYFSISEFSL